jgi:hypothetical protein
VRSGADGGAIAALTFRGCAVNLHWTDPTEWPKWNVS